MATNDIPKEEVDRIIGLVVRGFNDREPTVIEEAVAEHLFERSTLLGSLDFRERFQMALTILPDAKLEVEDYMIQGNLFAARWTIRGTHRAEFMGIPPSGKKISVRGFSVALVKNGRVTENWAFPDVPALMADLQAANE